MTDKEKLANLTVSMRVLCQQRNKETDVGNQEALTVAINMTQDSINNLRNTVLDLRKERAREQYINKKFGVAKREWKATERRDGSYYKETFKGFSIAITRIYE